MKDKNFCRIAIFYDGAFFQTVNNFYIRTDPRRTRINIEGLHRFIVGTISQKEEIDERFCHIAAAHYFAGRLPANQARKDYEPNALRGLLYTERFLEDLLNDNNVTPHYLPLQTLSNGERQEKGVDISLALESYELTLQNRYDVVVLIAGDSDYIPLVRKLKSLCARVIVVGWELRDFETETKISRRVSTSYFLMKEATYPLMMSTLLEEDPNKENEALQNIFIKKSLRDFNRSIIREQSLKFQEDTEGENAEMEVADYPPSDHLPQQGSDDLLQRIHQGRIEHIHDAYLFVENDLFDYNLFCHRTQIVGGIRHMNTGDKVSFKLGTNPKGGGPMAIQVRRINEEMPENGALFDSEMQSEDAAESPDSDTSTDRHRGVVCYIAADYTYAFLKAPQFPKNLFFHRSAMTEMGIAALSIGQTVSFEVGKDSDDKPIAMRVKVEHNDRLQYSYFDELQENEHADEDDTYASDSATESQDL